MDNNYFDFLGQNSVAGNENANANSNNDKGKVNLTVRVDADCQVVCDGDFLFLANANQIVKDKAPMGQHLMNFTSLDYPEATIEKIVDFPVEGNNYLIVVNELKEKVDELQKKREAEKLAKQQAEEEERQRIEEEKEAERLRIEQEKERNADIEKAMTLHKENKYTLAINLFNKHSSYLNDEQKKAYNLCKEIQKDLDKAVRLSKSSDNEDIIDAYKLLKKYRNRNCLNSEQLIIYEKCDEKVGRIMEEALDTWAKNPGMMRRP